MRKLLLIIPFLFNSAYAINLGNFLKEEVCIDTAASVDLEDGISLGKDFQIEDEELEETLSRLKEYGFPLTRYADDCKIFVEVNTKVSTGSDNLIDQDTTLTYISASALYEDFPILYSYSIPFSVSKDSKEYRENLLNAQKLVVREFLEDWKAAHR